MAQKQAGLAGRADSRDDNEDCANFRLQAGSATSAFSVTRKSGAIISSQTTASWYLSLDGSPHKILGR